MKSAIYETSGPAAEYCHFAMNHYAGCTHGCLYCYVPGVTHQSPSAFRERVVPRLTPDDIESSANVTVCGSKPILLSFISDPYPTIERFSPLTRSAIEILHRYGHNITVLTKAGSLAQRDFSLYQPGDSFGVTLTFLDENKSRHWEPHAALPAERLENLVAAKEAGIQTWVSLEPVISPEETLACIHAAAPFTDHFKVGKMNHSSIAQFDTATWEIFLTSAINAFHHHRRGFYVKKSLSYYIGYPGGYGEGLQLPETATLNILERV